MTTLNLPDDMRIVDLIHLANSRANASSGARTVSGTALT
jgi:hypothetical protein